MKEEHEHLSNLSGTEAQAWAKRHLVQVKVDDVNWKVLWRNPTTGAYWKEFFPQSELHGGGSSEFVRVDEAEAANEFGLIPP